MSTSVWPFAWLRPYTEHAVHQTSRLALNNGRTARRAEFGDYGAMTITGRVRVPMSSQDIAAWHAFVVARQGGYDSFLVKCHLTRHRTQTLEAVGTGDGSTTAFALDMRYVDASTLLVYKAGVLQTLTTHYTFSGNYTAPTVTFVSAPTGGQAITATYDYYYPMVFADDAMEPRDLHLTGSDATSLWEIPRVSMIEMQPGAHRA